MCLLPVMQSEVKHLFICLSHVIDEILHSVQDDGGLIEERAKLHSVR